MFDYLIIGAGSAGCVLAARLSEDRETTVCLLEAGPRDDSVLVQCPAGVVAGGMLKGWKYNWAFDTVPQPGLNGRVGYQPRGRGLGGSSSINAMLYVRGQREDYEHWAAEGNPGWDWASVKPYFLKAEHNERGADAHHAIGGPLNVMDPLCPSRTAARFIEAAVQAGLPPNRDFNGERQEGAGFFQVTQKGGERCSAARAYLVPNLGRPNLKVETGATVMRIVMDGRRATGVELHLDGGLQRLTARREVLLCAGALKSPQLLLLSGIGPGAQLRQHGLPVLHDLPGVGEHLHDHVSVTHVHDAPRCRDTFTVSPGGAPMVMKGAWDWLTRRQGVLTSTIAEAGAFFRSRPEETLPDLQLHFVITKLIDHARTLPVGHGYTCHLCPLRPASRGSVRLASADPRAAPLIDPNYWADPYDRDMAIRGLKMAQEIMRQPALKPFVLAERLPGPGVKTDQDYIDYACRTAKTDHHPAGTCRMGADAAAVVDTRLRFNGIDGLRVADASVMPTLISSNTNACAIMIGEKAADMLKADHAI